MKRPPPAILAPAIAIGAVVVAVVARLIGTGIQAYGTDGAPWIEHVARMQTLLTLRSADGAGVLDAIDGEFPPGLHLITLPWSMAVGHGEQAVALTGVAWMLLLAAGVGLTTAALSDRRVGWLAAALVCFLPAVHGAACRYYYDLPVLALIWLAAAAIVGWGERRPVAAAAVAAVACTLAWSVKWWALPTGLPLLVAAAAVAPGRRRLSPRAVAVAIVAGLVMVVGAWAFLQAAGEHNSLSQARVIMTGQDPLLAALEPADRPGLVALAFQRLATRSPADLLFYAGRGVGSVVSPALSVVLVFGLVVAIRRRAARPLLLLGLAAAGNLAFVYGLVPVLDDRFIVPSVVALVPAAAVGLSAAAQHRAWLLPTALAVGVLVTLEFHASPAGFWNHPVVAWDSELSRARPGDSSGEAGRDRIGKLRPAVVLRGLFAGSSVEDRGWTRRDEQPPAYRTERQAMFDAVLALEPKCIAVLAESPGFSPRGDSWWWRYRLLRVELETGSAATLTPLCGRGPLPVSCEPDVAVLPRGAEPSCVAADFEPRERPEHLPGLAVPRR